MDGTAHQFLWKEWNFLSQYDKISRSWNAETGGGWTLPLVWGGRPCREYDLIPAEVDAATAEEMLRTRLEQVLRAQLGSGTISRSEYTAVRAGDILTVTSGRSAGKRSDGSSPLTDRHNGTPLRRRRRNTSMTEQTINIERMEEAINIFGSFDENIRLIEQELGVTVLNRDSQLKVTGMRRP